jgi:hypothetical protein
MAEALVILEAAIPRTARDAVIRTAAATQSVSDRVYITAASDAALARLQSMPGVARVLTRAEQMQHLPPLNDAETLFVEAWMSTRGQTKQRRGEGLDWDTPPMIPPDPKR